jgi:hypothetical protein
MSPEPSCIIPDVDRSELRGAAPASTNQRARPAKSQPANCGSRDFCLGLLWPYCQQTLLTDKTMGAGHVAIFLDGSTYRERCTSSRHDFAIADRMHDARVGVRPVPALKDPAQSQAAMSRSETSRSNGELFKTRQL